MKGLSFSLTNKLKKSERYYWRVRGISADGKSWTWTRPRHFNSAAVGVEDAELPSEGGALAILGNWPNPFEFRTTIRIFVPAASEIHIEAFDILGRSVEVLQDRKLNAGLHDIAWRGTVPNGLYIIVVSSSTAATAAAITVAH